MLVFSFLSEVMESLTLICMLLVIFGVISTLKGPLNCLYVKFLCFQLPQLSNYVSPILSSTESFLGVSHFASGASQPCLSGISMEILQWDVAEDLFLCTCGSKTYSNG